MPELPEVEVTRRRLEPGVVGRTISGVEARTGKLRLPIPADLPVTLIGRKISAIERRGKYLFFFCDGGTLLVHLGMTGFLRLHDGTRPPGKHDHLDIRLDDGSVLSFHDPRKFGTVIWTTEDPFRHPLIAGIGPEPLSEDFGGSYLHEAGRKRGVAIKQFIMNSAVVAGVGNIYANEALFRAGIAPERPAGNLSREECENLASMIKEVLEESVEQGSTYRVAEETVSYHPLTFHVYGRRGERCTKCGEELVETRLGNRSTVYCSRCQR